MSKMGLGALVVATAMVADPAGAQQAKTPTLKSTYNALESAGTKSGLRERMYTGFTLDNGVVPITWSGFHELNVNAPGNYLGYDVLSFGNGGTRPSVMFTSTKEDTSVRGGFKSYDAATKLGGSFGYLDVSAGTKDANATYFWKRQKGPVAIELFESMNKSYRGGPVSFYSEIQPNVNLGKLGKRICGPVCDGMEFFYRWEFGGARDFENHLVGVRTQFKSVEAKNLAFKPAQRLARMLTR